MISLPLLGPIEAAGKTVPELEAEITQLLAEDFLQNPQVTVFVQEYTSQRITVEGAVKSPGIFPLSGRTSLLQAIVIAGGVTEYANPRGIIIFRVIDGKRMAAVYDLRDIRGGNAEDPLVYGDDLIVIDESGSKSAWRSLLQTMPVLGMFRIL
jgi:polysaccharide export outer membrane protein